MLKAMMLSAFEKRVKRRVVARTHRFFAVCPPGLESLCLKEMDRLDQAFGDTRLLPGGVAFEGKLATGYLANLHLGSPSRILMRLAEFKAFHFSDFEKQIRAVDWELFLPPGPDLKIRVSCKKSKLFHSQALAQRSQTIIESRLGPPGPDGGGCQTLMIRGENNRFILSLDMSGDLLHRRGVKTKIISAPLRETLAFALLQKIGYTGQEVLVDPMCGSGTFSLEAAMIKAGIPPGFFRRFAFENWPGFRPSSFHYMKNKAAQHFRFPLEPEIHASDIDPDAIQACRLNASFNEYLKAIQPRIANFFDLRVKDLAPQKGVVLLNPPYGKRLYKGMDTAGFFHEIGKKLCRDFRGWRMGIICPHEKAWKALGLNQLTPERFFHGGLDLIAGTGVI